MHALSRQRVQIGGQGGHQGLALAGLHFGNAPLVEHDAADQLHPIGPQAQHPVGRLPQGGKGLGQDVIQGLAFGQALLKFRSFGLELGIRERFVLL